MTNKEAKLVLVKYLEDLKESLGWVMMYCLISRRTMRDRLFSIRGSLRRKMTVIRLTAR